MIFITGPLYSGKREYIKTKLGLSNEEFESRAVCDVQELAKGKSMEEVLPRKTEMLQLECMW